MVGSCETISMASRDLGLLVSTWCWKLLVSVIDNQDLNYKEIRDHVLTVCRFEVISVLYSRDERKK